MRVIDDNRRWPKGVLIAISLVGWVVLLILCVVALYSSVERTQSSFAALRDALPEQDAFNARYRDNPWVTLAHTVPGVFFAVLGPIQFMPAIRKRAPIIHRYSGRLLLAAALGAGLSAIIIGFQLPLWGWPASKYILPVFAIAMIGCFAMGFWNAKRSRFEQHREWMIRGYSLGIAIAVFRLMLIAIMSTGLVDFTSAWNFVALSSFPMTYLVAEAWIQVTRRRQITAAPI